MHIVVSQWAPNAPPTIREEHDASGAHVRTLLEATDRDGQTWRLTCDGRAADLWYTRTLEGGDVERDADGLPVRYPLTPDTFPELRRVVLELAESSYQRRLEIARRALTRKVR